MSVKIGRNELCPCGSEKKAKHCCLKPDGQLKKSPANIFPDGPFTGFFHPKCFANVDHNCSNVISHEHFISETLLQQMNNDNTVKISGMKWQAKETFNRMPIPSLAPRILCTRHNNALSPLDMVIGRFSQMLQDYDKLTHPEVTAPKNEVRLFSGEDIEGWMLKCLLGATYSKNFPQSSIRAECLDILYGRMEWPSGWGLYVGVTTPGQVIYHSASLLIETFVDVPNKVIKAARFTLRGIPFYLLMGKPDNPDAVGIWRPSRLIYEDRKTEKIIELSWQIPASGQIVSWKRSGTYDGAPPDWKEWERNG
ncbi:MAG: SEC-C metal-binding domain-containing protein [Chloroflexota bacterium]